MQTIIRSSFTTVKTEGGLLPADLLQRVADGSDLRGLRPADYHLYEGERLNEAVNRAWNRCIGAWKNFKEQSEKLSASDSGTTLTRERWLLVLFQELGFGRLPSLRSGITVGDASFPISHLWQTTPIHLTTFRQDLDKRSDVGTAVKRSPHSLMQELLNRSPEYQWGVISNGLRLRILRDNASLRRAAFVEFDLAAMMDYELFADFALLWMVCHQSRFEPIIDTTKADAQKPARPAKREDYEEEEEGAEGETEQTAHNCWLEIWSNTAAEHGTRALDALRDGVKEAIEALGSGFLAHRENDVLRDKLRDGTLRPSDYYHQLRRMVYRLIFLAVAEDRNLLLVPETDADIRKLYLDHYSLRRLRRMSIAVRGGPHPDLYRQLRLLFVLMREGYPELGIPGLGSFLFSSRSTPDLDDLDLANHNLLTALRALSFAIEGGVRRPVDYRNLDSEELGSIYESLLELHPEVNLVEGTLCLNQGAGSERKTTGSHYTPTSLVECLLDTALEPVVADRLARAEELWRKSGERTPDKLRELQKDAILSIKVLDAATGSGHMLIGGGRRLARHLARILTGDDEPSPEVLRHAMRDVVRHCLYGVDLNNMAVELCKVALWMESMDPGKPLSFLDAHIQCGNSLIGVTPGLDIREIPDDAFQPVAGDDKTTAAGLRRRNKREREGQIPIAFGNTEDIGLAERDAGRRAQMVAAIEDLAEEVVGEVAAKERSYAEYLQSREYKRACWEADIWTAAFFWPIPKRLGEVEAPTQTVLSAVRKGELKQHESLLRDVRQLANQYRFFHWALQFPDVFNSDSDGFDVELGNPPWDRLRPEADKFFFNSFPEFASMSQSERNKRIDGLSEAQPDLYVAWKQWRTEVLTTTKYLKTSNKFPLSTQKNINSYAVFQELALQLVNGAGRAGLVLQSGIATDDINKGLFQYLICTKRLISLFDFENRFGLFPAVHRMMKFCLLTSGGSAYEKKPKFICYAHEISELADSERLFELSDRELKAVSPNTGLLPMFRHRHQADLVLRIYSLFGAFVVDGDTQGNPWQVQIRRLFSSYYDSSDLVAAEELPFHPSPTAPEDSRWVRFYEAKMLHQFDHRFASYQGAASKRIEPVERDQKRIAAYQTTPRYWASRAELGRRVNNAMWRPQYLLGYRDITNSANERTCIAAIIPFAAPDDTIRIVLPTSPQAGLLCALLANLNSFCLDFAARSITASTHLSEYIAKQLPILPPNAYTTDLLGQIVPLVVELTYTAWDLQLFAQDCDYEGPPFLWDDERRFLIRCELDAIYFHLYGIAHDDVDYIMETFPIVKDKDMAKHGEYRTKRVILEIYDEIGTAMHTGEPYETRLNPPPADPQVAHPV